MTARISHVTTDCHNAYKLSLFWAEVLAYAENPDDPNEPGDEECMIYSPDGHQRLLFIEVPDDKRAKNRLHLDLEPVDGRRDQELSRLLSVGAGVKEDLRRPDGSGWVVLTDPEGNEFCILRSAAERASHAATPT